MKIYYFILISILFLLTNCSEFTSNKIEKNTIKPIPKSIKKHDSKSIVLKKYHEFNLIDVRTLNKNIRVDLKYASIDNFMRIKLYDKLTKAFLQKDVAERLAKCQAYLTSLNPNYHLLIYDAVRPVSVQWKMWKALDTVPISERVKFVSNPANGSIHNYGAAVDLTICDKRGIPLDMGAGYDDIRQIAYPRNEAQFLASGELTQEHVNNRNLLREVMSSQAFNNIQTEWWHFNACNRNIAKEKYQVLERE